MSLHLDGSFKITEKDRFRETFGVSWRDNPTLFLMYLQAEQLEEIKDELSSIDSRLRNIEKKG